MSISSFNSWSSFSNHSTISLFYIILALHHETLLQVTRLLRKEGAKTKMAIAAEKYLEEYAGLQGYSTRSNSVEAAFLDCQTPYLNGSSFSYQLKLQSLLLPKENKARTATFYKIRVNDYYYYYLSWEVFFPGKKNAVFYMGSSSKC